jgi:hypothetical protein
MAVKMDKTIIQIMVGEFNEGGGFSIEMPYGPIADRDKCSHTVKSDRFPKYAPDFQNECRGAVVAVNEGGHNKTAVCIDCLLETLKQNGLI